MAVSNVRIFIMKKIASYGLLTCSRSQYQCYGHSSYSRFSYLTIETDVFARDMCVICVLCVYVWVSVFKCFILLLCASDT